MVVKSKAKHNPTNMEVQIDIMAHMESILNNLQSIITGNIKSDNLCKISIYVRINGCIDQDLLRSVTQFVHMKAVKTR